MSSKRSLLALAALFCLPASASAILEYNADTVVAGTSDGTFVQSGSHVLQVVTLVGGNSSNYTLNNLGTIGINWSSIAQGNQTLFIDIWTNVNTATGAGSALAGATHVGGVGFNLTTPAATGSYNYGSLTVNGGTFGIEITFGNTAGTAYSTALNGRYTTGTPSVGSNDGFVYFDGNLDGVFAGSERARLTGASGNAAPTNYRLSINATPVAVPEASTAFAGLGAALAVGGVIVRRRRGAVA